MRLLKYLAHAGVASRRASEQLVRDGRVTVGGEVVYDPARDVDGSQQVAVDSRPVRVRDGERAVYALNKPAGVVSTASDPQGRQTVVSLIPSARRLYPVGRLDADTTGLILLTDDGPLAHRLTHPSFQVPRVYRATVRRPPVREQALASLRDGVELDDGKTAPARVRRLAHDRIELTIREGRERQVRRMCEAVGHRVAELERVAFGPLGLGGLQPGEYRRLTAKEIERLRSAGGAQEKPSRGGPAKVRHVARPKPPRAGGERPSPGGDATTSPGPGGTSSRAGAAKPSRGRSAAPARGGDAKPARGRPAAPSRGGDAKPSRGRPAAPARGRSRRAD